ncbi:MAG: class I SAM-dependent methyltransferase [Alphaproteobacteria bacterium]|nr:class I SAM-dependent methyltransferase [Alphaproteobacteria bacterium]
MYKLQFECLACGASNDNLGLDAGNQPVAAHFQSTAEERADEYPLRLGICDTCATVQLVPPFPAEALVPQVSWLKYREPEDHLDGLVDDLVEGTDFGPQSVVIGVSFKDQSTVERLSARGAGRCLCLDVVADLGSRTPAAGVESVPVLLNADRARQLAGTRGPADIVVARHVLEHAGRPAVFIDALSALLRDGGYLVIEVPDCSKNIAREEYAMIWEEHALYFTEPTFRSFLARHGFEPVTFTTYPYSFEDVFVAIVRKTGRGGSGEGDGVAAANLEAGQDAFRHYCERFPHWSRSLRARIETLSGGVPAAVFGAGHLSAAFLNFHGLSDLFGFVVDDTPEKQGLYLPNSGLQIVPGTRLAESGAKLCLLGLSPQSEEKVIAKNQAFTAAGGRFYSLLADSGRSIRSVSVADS